MNNAAEWQPGKFVYRNGRLRASRDTAHVGVGSRLAADCVAACFDRLLPQHASGRLLDLGCGSVPLYEAYRDRVSAITCADWGNTPHSQTFIDVECDLSEPLPFGDNAFETIILSDVLEHVPEPAALWHEMARVLSPGGKVLVSVPFYYGIHEAPFDFYRYTGFALRRFAERAGLQLLSLEPVGGSLEVFADMLAKHASRIPLLGHALAVVIQSPVWWLHNTGLGQRLMRSTARYFPFGYCLVAQKPQP